MSFAKAIVASLVSIVFVGCAFTRTETKVNFTPQIMSPLMAVASESSMSLAKIKDTRSVKDERVLMHKKNGYGQTTTGAYVADRPVAEILQSGVMTALRQNRFPVTDESGKYELRGDLQDFSFEVITGFWSGTVKPKISVRFEVVEKETGRSVWRDTYVGRDTMQASWGDAALVAEMFTKAANSIVDQLIADESFRSLFVGGATPTASLK